MANDSDDDDVLYSSANLDQNRTLIGGEAKNLDDIMNSPRHRMKKTFGLCAAFLGLGLSVAILGPTLHSLKDQVQAQSMDTMGIVFSGRGLGYLGGTVIGGFFFDYWNPQVLIAASLGLASIGLLVAAFTKTLLLLIILMATVGVAMGVLDTGANVVCIKMWGRRSSAFLQMLHFAFAVGACLSPLLATPFIKSDLLDTECMPNGALPPLPAALSSQEPPGASVTVTTTTLSGIPVSDKTVAAKISSTPSTTVPAMVSSNTSQTTNSSTAPTISSSTVLTATPSTTELLSTVLPETTEAGPCEVNPCLNGGTCTHDKEGDPEVCTCVDGFTGPFCNSTTKTKQRRGIRGVADPCDSDSCSNGGVCVPEGDKFTCTCAPGFKGDSCTEKDFAVDQGGFRGIYILIAVYLFAVSMLFCYFTYLSPVTGTPTHRVQKTTERSSFEVKILFLLFCFYLLYVGGEVAFGCYITDYYRAMPFGDVCHATLAAAWFWATFAFGRGLAICLATVLTPWTMVVTDLTGGVISTIILVYFADSPGWFWLGTGLLGLSIASLFPSGIAWLEGYVDVSGKVASVLVTGGVFGEMVLPLLVGSLMFRGQKVTDGTSDQYETATHPEWLMYVMCFVCVVSAGLFAYVFFLANELGLKNSVGKQNSVAEVFDGFSDAFRMKDIDKKPPKQLRRPIIIGKKHKL